MAMSLAVWFCLVTGANAILRDSKLLLQARADADHSLSFLTSSNLQEREKVSDQLSSREAQAPRVPLRETTSHQSWFSKMAFAIAAAAAGVFLIIFSITLLWENEHNAAKLESVISIGESECISLTSTEADSDKCRLVHCHGGNAKALEAVADERCEALFASTGVLRLRTTVEAYQWVEHSETTNEKDRFGGGTTSTTRYTYEKRWSVLVIDSNHFNQGTFRNFLMLADFDLGVRSMTCGKVACGQFMLPPDLVEQLQNFEDGAAVFGSTISRGSASFQKGTDCYYYYPQRTGALSEPEVGDMRMSVEIVKDGPVTVLGLSIATEEPSTCTFLPYRAVSRGFLCGITEEELEMRLRREGRMTSEELFAKEKVSCPGPLSCLFCCCLLPLNLVSLIFASMSTPQIYALFPGDVDRKACFDRVRMKASVMKWVIRAVGWALLFIGLSLIFEPFTTFLDIVPLLGPSLSWLGGSIVFLVAFIVSAAVASLLISAAYMLYHPFIGLAYLIVTAAVVAIPIVVLRCLQ